MIKYKILQILQKLFLQFFKSTKKSIKKINFVWEYHFVIFVFCSADGNGKRRLVHGRLEVIKQHNKRIAK